MVRTLRSLMRDTVTDGTAKMLADLPGEVGAKTGTAEVTKEGPNNGWLVAYDDEIAIACVVESAQHGSDSAGPVDGLRGRGAGFESSRPPGHRARNPPNW